MTDATDPTPDATGTTYIYKPSVMGGMCAFRATPDVLQWEVGRHNGAFPYSAIRRIRLSYKPITLANYRFIAEIWADGVPKLTVSSTSWKSIVEQGRQDADYLTFLRALHDNIQVAGADPSLEIGSPPLIYWPGVVIAALMFAVMPVIIYRTAREGAWPAATLITAFLAYCLWYIGGFFYRNRPGFYRADALPPQVLPKD